VYVLVCFVYVDAANPSHFTLSFFEECESNPVVGKAAIMVKIKSPLAPGFRSAYGLSVRMSSILFPSTTGLIANLSKTKRQPPQ
jgi:hypothetical protein